MTEDEELVCRSWNRDLYCAWAAGEVTFREAVFIAKRDIFLTRLLDVGMSRRLIEPAGWLYDVLFESWSL